MKEEKKPKGKTKDTKESTNFDKIVHCVTEEKFDRGKDNRVIHTKPMTFFTKT